MNERGYAGQSAGFTVRDKAIVPGDPNKTLGQLAGSAAAGLAVAHEVVDRIESILFGPFPQSGGPAEPPNGSLVGQLELAAGRSEFLVKRLVGIADRLV